MGLVPMPRFISSGPIAGAGAGLAAPSGRPDVRTGPPTDVTASSRDRAGRCTV